MSEYTTLAVLKASLQLQGVTGSDADLELAIKSASRAIDKATNRRFFPDEDPVTRSYRPASEEIVLIDDLTELETLVVAGEQWSEGTGFALEPLNAPADGEPWTLVRAMRPLRGTVEITGRFGWPTAPDPIRAATAILAVKLVKRAREAPFGVASFGVEGGAMRIALTDPDVQFLIEPFRHGVLA